MLPGSSARPPRWRFPRDNWGRGASASKGTGAQFGRAREDWPAEKRTIPPRWTGSQIECFLFCVCARRFRLMNIYVGNMSYETTESELREAFAAFGEVSRVSIITDRETGRPPRFRLRRNAQRRRGQSGDRGHEPPEGGRPFDHGQRSQAARRPRRRRWPPRRRWPRRPLVERPLAGGGLPRLNWAHRFHRRG